MPVHVEDFERNVTYAKLHSPYTRQNTFAAFLDPFYQCRRTNKNLRKHKQFILKPRPNDRNMSTQHIATMLGATCCVGMVRSFGRGLTF